MIVFASMYQVHQAQLRAVPPLAAPVAQVLYQTFQHPLHSFQAALTQAKAVTAAVHLHPHLQGIHGGL